MDDMVAAWMFSVTILERVVAKVVQSVPGPNLTEMS
jgi:hypothetical protein